MENKTINVGDKVVFAECNEILTGVVVIVYKSNPGALIIKTEDGKEFIKHPSQALIAGDLVIEQIEQWFKDAIPNPTNEDLCVQLGCHFEEVWEGMDALDCDVETRVKVKLLSENFKKKDTFCLYDCYRCNIQIYDKITLVDAMADQIVTAIGVLYMLGVDPKKALKEVVRSNDSKRNPETGELDRDENGKIKKGVNYEEPDLLSACEVE